MLKKIKKEQRKLSGSKTDFTKYAEESAETRLGLFKP
jgi:hypothetical protein